MRELGKGGQEARQEREAGSCLDGSGRQGVDFFLGQLMNVREIGRTIFADQKDGTNAEGDNRKPISVTDAR